MTIMNDFNVADCNVYKSDEDFNGFYNKHYIWKNK